jgi:hydrogenase-4 component F
MNILYMLGPTGVIVLALIGYRRPSRRLRLIIAWWVSFILLFTIVSIYPDLRQGSWTSLLIVGTNVVATTSAWDSVWWIQEHPSINAFRYYTWWALFWASLTAISIAGNLVFSWLAIEFSTLVSSALIVEMRSRRAVEAAWKYVVIASVGLFMALIGILFLYASLRSQGLGWHTLDYVNIQAHASTVTPIVKKIITILIVSGIGTKAGLVPFHTWLPDAHSEAPSPASGLLSGVLLGLCLVTIERFLSKMPLSASALTSGPHLLLLFGSLSVIVGTFALLAQRDVKRLLAYSSIEQIGIAAIGFGINTPMSREAALLQLAFHAVIKSSLFYVGGHLSVSYGSTRLQRMTNMMYQNRKLSIVWATGLLALAGLPPLGLAYSEWMILLALWRAHLWVVLVVLSVSLALGFAALLYHLIRGLWDGQLETQKRQGIKQPPLLNPMIRTEGE